MKKYLLLLILNTLFLIDILSQDNSVLSSGDWFEITTDKNGVYKLDYADLQSLGVDLSSLSIEDIKLYGNGGGMLPYLNSDDRHSDLVENSVRIYDYNSNGFFEVEDYILFYGMSSDVWTFNESLDLFEHEEHLFADEVSYFINIDHQSEGKRIALKDELDGPTTTITHYDAYAHHEEDLENLIQSGRKWFGERFYTGNSNKLFSFSLPNVLMMEDATIKIAVAARSLQPSSFSVSVNSSSWLDFNNFIASTAFNQFLYFNSKETFSAFTGEISLSTNIEFCK